MRLRLTDENWQWLRTADQYAALFRATEVAYNNATLLRPKSLVSSADSQRFNMRVLTKDDVLLADYSKFSFTRVEKDVATSADDVRFQFVAGVSDSAVIGEFHSFALSFLLKSPAAAVDFVQCTFQAGLFDSAAGTDRVSVTISTLVRDSVTAVSGFLLSGRAFQNTASSVVATDAFYSTFTDPQPDSVGASDFIEIGIRYVVDFYFGGMSFGGSPFGGRTI